ncbi:glycoside hydrolase [Leucosporidium creatinivorum]|uniref:alpha-1,2-Mannosidase n=1 Tax=Leucosporidium creatinivorum TaxID=106004 RepID=A0A1Y2G1N3_9BASI|nr:glycoside hydrolase [Leucosporidium creatinivorum]
MILDSSSSDDDDETLPLSTYPPRSPPPSPGFASRLQSYTRFLRGPRALLLAVLLTVYLALSHYNNSRRSPPLGYTSLGPQDGFEKAPEGPQLPILVLPNGTRYQHPLRPSWPEPWPHRPDVASLLSSWRFPPTEGTIGVDADSVENVARRVLVGQGTKAPRSQFEVPKESLRDADAMFGRDAEEWKVPKLSKGEGYGKDGRPLQVPRDALHTGRNAGWKPPKLGSKKALPRVQKESKDTRTEEHKIQDSQRREWVRKAFLHLWENYKESAWGHDELRPLSKTATDNFNGWSATIFDSLDTLLLMGLEEEYLLAREHVTQVDFSYLTPKDPRAYSSPSAEALPPLSPPDALPRMASLPLELISPQAVPTFETTIRYLGALLAAFDLSADPLMLARAVELGNWLLPSLSTRSGLLVPTYKLGSNSNGGLVGQVVFAEVASVSLEFTRLSQLTGDPIYFEAISRTTDTLDNWRAAERLPHLFPTQINPDEPRFLPGVYSAYEYLIKEHQLLQGASEQYLRMYTSAIDSAYQHLIRPINVVPGKEGMVTIGDLHFRELHEGELKSWYSMRLDHLTAFAGGMLGLGAKLLDRPKDMETAVNFTSTCVWAYEATRSGLAPEIMQFWVESDSRRWETVQMADGSKARAVKGDPMGVHSGNNYHIQRPETIESVWYMYRLTGDRAWQDKGWMMFTNWVAATIIEGGFAHVLDVNRSQLEHDDSGVESFVYGET